MAKEILATGTITVSVCKDSFKDESKDKNENKEEVTYFFVEVPVDDELGIVERAKFKSPSAYGFLARKLRSQTNSAIKINKTAE